MSTKSPIGHCPEPLLSKFHPSNMQCPKPLLSKLHPSNTQCPEPLLSKFHPRNIHCPEPLLSITILVTCSVILLNIVGRVPCSFVIGRWKFKCRSARPLFWCFCAFPQSLQADADTPPQTWQQSLPFTYFTIHYSSVILNLTLHSLSYWQRLVKQS